MTKSFLLRVLQMTKEPSSWAGLAGVLGGIGFFGFTTDMWGQVFSALVSVAGVLAMIIGEKSTDE